MKKKNLTTIPHMELLSHLYLGSCDQYYAFWVAQKLLIFQKKKKKKK